MRTKNVCLTPLISILVMNRTNPALTLFMRLYPNNRWNNFDQKSLIQMEK